MNFSYLFEWKPTTFTTGIIAKLIGNSQYDFGYNGSAFYLIVNGTTFVSQPISLSQLITGTLFPSEPLFPSETLYPFGGYEIVPFIIMLTNNGARIKVRNTIVEIQIAL